MNLAEQYENEENYEKAYEEYKKNYENNVENVHILQKLAHIASILGKKDEAMNFYKKVITIDENNMVAYEQLIDIAFENGDKFTYYLSRAQLHVLQEQYEHAITNYKKAISHCDDEKKLNSTRYLLANIYEKQNKYNQAIDQYLSIADTEDVSSDIYLRLADLYDKTGFTESAVEVLQRAKDDGFEGISEALAKYYSKINCPQKAYELTSNELLKARSLMEMDKTDDALKLLESIQSKYKKNVEYISLLAQYYFVTGDYETALIKVDEYSKLSPNSPLIYQMKALIYEKKGDDFLEHVNWAKYNVLRGNTDIAINEYLTAHQIDETNKDIILTIADMLDVSDKTRAVEFYEKLYDLDNTNKHALQKLAEFRDKIGDYVKMVDYLEQLKKLDSRNQYVLQNYDRAVEMVTNPPSIFDSILNFFLKK